MEVGDQLGRRHRGLLHIRPLLPARHIMSTQPLGDDRVGHSAANKVRTRQRWRQTAARHVAGLRVHLEPVRRLDHRVNPVTNAVALRALGRAAARQSEARAIFGEGVLRRQLVPAQRRLHTTRPLRVGAGAGEATPVIAQLEATKQAFAHGSKTMPFPTLPPPPHRASRDPPLPRRPSRDPPPPRRKPQYEAAHVQQHQEKGRRLHRLRDTRPPAPRPLRKEASPGTRPSGG